MVIDAISNESSFTDSQRACGVLGDVRLMVFIIFNYKLNN